MSYVKILTAITAISVSVALVQGCGEQGEDEIVVREAIEGGVIDSDPFPLEGRVWADWVDSCGNFLSYRSFYIKHWEEVAEATRMTAEQRAKAEALYEKYKRIHEQFDKTTTPVRNELEDRMEEARKAGNEDLAETLNRLRHVQTHQKLAIEGAATEDLLRLLTEKQLRRWHEYRVTKHAAKRMRDRIYHREFDDTQFAELAGLTLEQKGRIEKLAWKLAREEFLPTVEHPEDVSAFAIYGEDEKRAKAMADEKLYPQVVREVLTDAQREKLEVSRGLILKPCTIELVDGRTVTGQLAVQFDMPDRFIVYSPRLATVRSFLKDHMHALTVEGKRKVLNPKRELTDEEAKLLGRIEWPDEPPAEGPKPAYTTETWEKPEQLLVWARPGRSGRLREASGWLANGKPMDSLPKTEIWTGPSWNRSKRTAEFNQRTDILIPAAQRSYSVRGGAHWHLAKGVLARHVTVESGSSLQANVRGGVFGNLWISPHSQFSGGGCAYFRGTQHTFLRNGDPRPLDEPIDWPTIQAKSLARKWVLRKDDPDASMEIIGGAGSGDETHIQVGRLIVSEGSTVLIGPRCCQTIGPAAALQLQSGAIFANNANQPHKQDMLVRGRLQAGSPERPIRKDCYVGLSYKDHGKVFASDQWQKREEYRGLEIWPDGEVRVFSADPVRARLAFCYHGKEGFGDTGAPPSKGEAGYETYQDIPRQIGLTIWAGADVQLDGVLFEDVRKAGIRLQDPGMREEWRNVFYGERNGGSTGELFARYVPSQEHHKEVMEASGAAGDADRFFGVPLFVRDDKPIWEARIEPVGGQFPAGEPVLVVLRIATNQKDLDDVEIRYTLDGSDPGPESHRYTDPFQLAAGTTVKGRCFRDGEPLRGTTAEAVFEFITPRAPDTPAETKPGLVYRYYRGTWRRQPNFEKDSPLAEGTAMRIAPNVRPEGKDTVVLFTGYLEVPREGVYRFHPRPVNSGRVSIGGKIVWDPSPLHPERQKAELVVLAPGRHRFQVAYFFGEGVHEGRLDWEAPGDEEQPGGPDSADERPLGLEWEGPGIERQPVPPDAFSH